MAGLAKGVKNILSKSANDVVILSALRTPFTRAKKGHFRDSYDHQMLAAVLKATYDRYPNLDPSKINDVQIGTVLSELGGSKAGRMAALHVGVPETTPFCTVNRACASGLAAITNIAHAIMVGQIDVGIGGGMESMTKNYGSRAIPTALWGDLKQSPVQNAKDCIMSMGITAENVADRYKVSRQEQDEFALHSHEKAVQAQKGDKYKDEIIPVDTKWIPNEDAPTQWEPVTVTKDDGVRANSNLEKLSTMKAAFKTDGSVTAGNSSQVSDGAAAVLMMRRSTAQDLGLGSSIIGKWAGTVTVGCRPDEMGIGPALAVPKLLDHTGITKDDVGVWEINEAFASQAVFCIGELGLDDGKVNPNGGAIALGHPLGATGPRQVATILPELARQDQQLGVVSLCIGTGMGMASLIVRE